jgi:hypothetical protein
MSGLFKMKNNLFSILIYCFKIIYDKSFKKCEISVFSICLNLIKTMSVMKKGVKNLRKMRIFESFFSRNDKITVKIRIFLENFNFCDFFNSQLKEIISFLCRREFVRLTYLINTYEFQFEVNKIY